MKTITKDPVCGMEVEESSPLRTTYDDTTYLFCSEKCRDRFQQNPEKFVEGARAAAASPGQKAGVGAGHARQHRPARRWRDYLPLIVIVGLTLAAAGAKQQAYAGSWNWMTWMHDFMGFFLVVFSMFKFFNLEGFVDGFQMYDLLAKRFRPYALVYPCIELGLGLGYLANWQPLAIYVATIAVMVFGSLGVFRALAKGLDVDCACMGTALQVPLSTVALVEDLGMAAMAAAMLISVA